MTAQTMQFLERIILSRYRRPLRINAMQLVAQLDFKSCLARVAKTSRNKRLKVSKSSNTSQHAGIHISL